ncbi:PH domain-containing protein [Cryobacterium sp. PH31-O1]|uniref:PH domain-containing protein n=1 Tax=Cryobacterium sp. PH31-O1 TaxID=3046306 RepID=UPI0024B91F2E|nr:PH domain-containing protein [Cryobacterium sp. PH31-O1]MDJ0337886.1 PH domain-containing protein [Cryobacterium sp. PH31-O1]
MPDLPEMNRPAALPPVPQDVPVPDDSAEPAEGADPSARLELSEPGEWKRVSPKYVLVEIVGTIVNAVVVCGGASLLWLLLDQTWALWVGIAVLVASIINLVFEPRRVRSIGYLLREDDLLFRRGILFQRFVAVPYGRMQLIDITRGPIARWLGLADLKFVTAAATAGVSIPGLPEADAESLRDRLVELAESRRAGL